MFQLSKEEFSILRSQFVTLKKGRGQPQGEHENTFFSPPLKIRGAKGVMKEAPMYQGFSECHH
jgi:hypothetical protein